MANPQLTDYVQGQLKLGVTKEVIKGALTTAGWQAKDVEEVLGAVSAPDSEGTPASAPAFKVSEINFQPKDIAGVKKSDEKGASVAKPAGTASGAGALASLSHSRGGTPKWLLLLLGLLAVLGIAAAVFFYLQMRNVRAAVTQLNADKAGLSGNVAAAMKENGDLKAKIAASAVEIADLNDTLLLFIAPSGTTTQEVSLTASGVLSGGDAKNPYVVTTARGVRMTIKNGKLANVEPVLKSLVGTTVQVAVTHVPGSSQVTLTTVNGKGFVAASVPSAKP